MYRRIVGTLMLLLVVAPSNGQDLLPTGVPVDGPPPPPVGPGGPDLAFAFAFGSDMVLQQKPARAAVYGTVRRGLDVAVKVQGAGTSYTVKATVDNSKGVNSTWKAFLQPANAGGEWTITATAGPNTATLDRVTFGDVWYCAGQSNMALSVYFTFGKWATVDAIRAGKYSNIRIHGLRSNMQCQFKYDQPWINTSKMGNINVSNKSQCMTSLLSFSSTCWYFGQSLTDELGDNAPPIGLIHTGVGGSRIEQWLDNATLATCKNVTRGPSDAYLHSSKVLPYAGTTLKGWVWHQGENDSNEFFGNSARGSGYGCNLVNLVKTWRELWSSSAGTTDPMAPFGIATIASTSFESSANDVGGLHWAQTANYGVAPNPVLPNTFLAQTFDLNDPFQNMSCGWYGHNNTCCGNFSYSPKCHSCYGPGQYCEVEAKARFYMGPIHPRDKLPVGQRLAKSAAAIAYNKPGPYTGPTISGCSKQGGKITINFNRTLLGNDQVLVQDYTKTMKSSMQVLTNSSLFCVQTSRSNGQCLDDGTGQPLPYNGSFGDTAWQEVDIAHASATSITVDLAKSNGVAFALRYAWDGECCAKEHGLDGSPCPIASCPLMSKLTGHPANPFFAKIVNGKCECLAPQVCDESGEAEQLVIL